MNYKLKQIISKNAALKSNLAVQKILNSTSLHWWYLLRNLPYILKSIIDLYDLIIEYLTSEDNGRNS